MPTAFLMPTLLEALPPKLGNLFPFLTVPPEMEYGDFCLFYGTLAKAGMDLSVAKNLSAETSDDFSALPSASYCNITLSGSCLSRMVALLANACFETRADFEFLNKISFVENSPARPWKTGSAQARAARYLQFLLNSDESAQAQLLVQLKSKTPVPLENHELLSIRAWLRGYMQKLKQPEDANYEACIEEALSFLFKGKLLSFRADTTSLLMAFYLKTLQEIS